MIFRYEKELVRLIKTLPLYAWDKQNLWWTIAHTEGALAKLAAFCDQNGWIYRYLEDLHHLDRKPRLKPDQVENYRQVPDCYLDKLTVLRYSSNTIKTYNDSKPMMIHIQGGKGKKDRITLLSVRLLEILREYYRLYKLREYLFAGQMGGQYSERSAQLVLKEAARRAGITRHVTLHTLRHSFATHLLENGNDLRYIQSLLGHSSPKTIQIYTHITTKGFDQIKNPLDNLGL